MEVYLVTGGAGFIGSYFIKLLLGTKEDVAVINIDKLTYAGNIKNNAAVYTNASYTFIQQDICDKHAVHSIFKKYGPDYVINFAAESHVDRSISGSEVFMRTNVLGTHVLLQAALQHDIKGFIQVSTDEVYGATDVNADLSEAAALFPGNPYAASKAAGDMMALAYSNTYGLPVMITRSSNNFGFGQNDEKLIPMVIGKCLKGEDIPVYGNGLQIRDWIYVEDNCSAVYSVLKKGRRGQIYNICANNRIDNISLIKRIIRITKDMLPPGDQRKQKIEEGLITFVEDRKGHDRCYSISPEKIRTQVGWNAEHDFNSALEHTVKLYLDSLS
ncbi:MAG: dTDP-glucose 4,6-dehydratase [Clostridia bacterium BRH_c25]|nr:MAG: dTDP-glucose 4,6-dehydratase [Clostridia bacterium BRH_c25]